MTARKAKKSTPPWLAFIQARWKAVAATVMPLIGGVLYLVSTGQLDVKHLAGFLAIALGSGVVTHQVPNLISIPPVTVGDVVSEVTDALQPGATDG